MLSERSVGVGPTGTVIKSVQNTTTYDDDELKNYSTKKEKSMGVCVHSFAS